MDDERSDVIRAAILVRQIDEMLGGHAWLALAGHLTLDRSLVDIAMQAVATEQQTVPIVHGLDEEVGGDVRLCAQATGDDVAVAVAARLLLGQESDAHLLGDPRVILRDLTQLAIADDIGAAVADVDDIGAATSEDERDTGR